MKRKKRKKSSVKTKISNILNSYKTIIYISFLIIIILIALLYNNIRSNKVYSFSGKDDYIEVKDGILSLSNDINLLNGNNIKYINATDYEVKSFKIGYYVMDDTKLINIVTSTYNADTSIKLSELINNFTSLNVVEKNNNKVHFTRYNKSLIDDGVYLVIEAKTTSGENIVDKLKLNMTKISKY